MNREGVDGSFMSKREKVTDMEDLRNSDIENPKKKRKGSAEVKIDNSSQLLKKVAMLYADHLMNDICLNVNGKEYPAHRLILCASSDVFQIMLMKPHWNESNKRHVNLFETQECADVFEDFLLYFYTGKITFRQHSIMGILTLADKYNLKDLVALCIDYMRKHLVEATEDGCIVSWFQRTLSVAYCQLPPDKYQLKMAKLWTNDTCYEQAIDTLYNDWDYLRTACKNHIKWNFETVASSKGFQDFEADILETLLLQNDLVVSSEVALYRIAVNWLNAQKERIEEENPNANEKTYLDLIKRIMSNIRFPMMSPRELAQLIISPLVSKYKEFFIERMAVGISFHSGEAFENWDEITTARNGKFLFTPRLYTSDQWSSSIMINNYTAHPSYQPRTLVCTTSCSLRDYNADRTCEWVVDLYPKGLWFQKGCLIEYRGVREIPEEVIKDVRISITCKDPPENGVLLKIGILISGVQCGVEHVMDVAYYKHHFTRSDSIYSIKKFMPYKKLNSRIFSTGYNMPNDVPHNVPYLTGPNRNTLKVQVILIPLCRQLSCTDTSYNSTRSLLYSPLC